MIFVAGLAAMLLCGQDNLPTEWTDADTGHRVIRLSKEADGKKLVVTNPHGIPTINLATREIDQMVERRVNILVTGHKTGHIYYTRDGAILATDLDTHATREVAKIPPQAGRGDRGELRRDAACGCGG